MHGEICIGDAINWDHPLNRGLVSRWLALPDQQRGVMFRDLCMRNHGTLTNNPLWQGAMGRPGGHGSLGFDGSDDFVDTTIVGTHAAWTIGAWVRLTAAGNYPMIVARTNFNVDLRFKSTARLPEVAANGISDTTSPDALALDEWHHIVATSDGALVTLYVDSMSKASNSGTPPSWTGSTTIGKRSDGFHLTGQIDDVSIFNRALSASEVQALYNESRQGNPNTLNWIRRPWMAQAAAGVTGSPWYYHLQQRAAA